MGIQGIGDGRARQARHTDYLGASLVALSSISALEYRDRTGKGQFIELAQVEAQGAIMGPAILDSIVNGHEWEAMGYGEILGSHYAPYGAYPCKGDDEWIVVSVETDEEWQGFVNAMGSPTWAQDPAYSTHAGRVAAKDDLDAQIGDWTSGFTKRQVMRILQNNGVPAGAKYTGEDLYSDVHFRQRGHIVDVHEPPWGDLSHQGLPGIPSLAEAHGDGPPPWIGVHNDYVFKTLLGLSDEIRRRPILRRHPLTPTVIPSSIDNPLNQHIITFIRQLLSKAEDDFLVAA